MSAEAILSRPLTKRQKAVLDGIAKRQASGDDGHIDYSDIPALSAKKLVAVVFEWIRKFGAGYSTRINNILRVVMSQQP